MMMNLFSSFDPSTGFMSLNWLSSIVLLLFIPIMYWYIPNRFIILYSKIIYILNKELNMLMYTQSMGMTLIFLSLFLFILFNNLLGLMPYIFTSSSHLVFTMSMALPLWLSFMLYGFIKNTNYMFCHLVPSGTPKILMPFMVVIESISNLIRPGSLAVRLTANMIAGHILMTLLGNSSVYYSLQFSIVIMIFQMLLMMFEVAVCIIQSYVFMVLGTLYYSEVNYE